MNHGLVIDKSRLVSDLSQMFALAALGHEDQDEDHHRESRLRPLKQSPTTLSLNRSSFLRQAHCLNRCLRSFDELSLRWVTNHGLSVESHSVHDENSLVSPIPSLWLFTTLGFALVTDLSVSDISRTKEKALLVLISKFWVKFRLNLASAQTPEPPDPPDPPDFMRLRVTVDAIMVSSCLLPSDSKYGGVLVVSTGLVMLDMSCISIIPSVLGVPGYVIVPSTGTLVAFVRSFTALCRLFSLTAVCRFRSVFALMVIALMWLFSSLWQFGKEIHHICIFLKSRVLSGFHCPHISFMECLFLPNLSLAISGTVNGSIVLEVVLFGAEAKRLIVSRVDGIDCLALTTLEVLNLPLCGFDQGYQHEEVILFVLPCSDTTLAERMSSLLSFNLYLRFCCLRFTKCLSNLLVNTLACSALCSLVVSSLSGVKLF
ncbi:hypothetical protein AALP_AA2G156900 [Arabis alpina]|uniref:Uncharacterized protein n=1 Tax=Arabis alpina TaxID=50452 RepID=A0A087HHR2_ARAAL|nr:hypothetical protein AALP_AA2G156900 [Arabis alpina]